MTSLEGLSGKSIMASLKPEDRFVSETDINEARERGEELVKEVVDRRPLAVQLAEQNKIKEEAMKEKFKHQPPKAYDAEEAEFETKREEQRRRTDAMRAEHMRSELQAFREQVEAAVLIDRTKEPESSAAAEQPLKKQRLADDLVPSEKKALFTVSTANDVPMRLKSTPKELKRKQPAKKRGGALNLLAGYGSDDD